MFCCIDFCHWDCYCITNHCCGKTRAQNIPDKCYIWCLWWCKPVETQADIVITASHTSFVHCSMLLLLHKYFKLSVSVIVLKNISVENHYRDNKKKNKVTECAPSSHQEAGNATGSALTPWGGCGQCWRRTGSLGPSHERLQKLSLSINLKEWKVTSVII